MKMGELVNLAAWKKKREAEAYASELAEIAELRAEVKRLMDDMGEPAIGPYHLDEDEKEWMTRAMKIMLTSLDGYSNWPIDSSDL